MQGRKQTILGMNEALNFIKLNIQQLRSEEQFHSLWQDSLQLVKRHNLCPFELPRRRNPVKHLNGPAENYHSSSVEEYYRREFYLVLDVTLNSLEARFNQQGIKVMKTLENTLISGDVCDNLRSILN